MKGVLLAAALTFGPYQADLVRVVDGDTFEVDIHTYPGQVNRVMIREDGINTPEKRTRSKCEKAAGIAATQYAAEFLEGKQITVINVRRGKYAGRLLGNVLADGAPLGPVMLSSGHARPYHGGRRQSWCADAEA